MSLFTIAIDGPSATGKSTISRQIAEKYNLLYVDSGRHFRAITNWFLINKIPLDDFELVNKTISKLNFSSQIENFEILFLINDILFELNSLRTLEINEKVSIVANIPIVRTYLLNYQRGLVSLVKSNGFDGIIMEGRDIGTTIFPKADLKFYMEASESVRMARRLNEGNQDVITKRDKLDSSRTISPLIPAKDVIFIDTNKSKELVFQEIATFVSKKTSAK